jgi:two-component system response regulator (stage 0 sporulation protein F)
MKGVPIEMRPMPKILAIDDEVGFTQMITNYFKPRGFEIFTATRGQTGLEIAKKELPDIILIDLKMPGLDGDEVIEELKQISPRTKTIMITAFQDDGKTKARVLQNGAYAYFEKPVSSLRELESTIRKALKD